MPTLQSTKELALFKLHATSLSCRAGWWLDNFMGYGSTTGGSAWQFPADGGGNKSSRITGYLGRAGQFVGCIAFNTGSF
jgi:hypothetical protein